VGAYIYSRSKIYYIQDFFISISTYIFYKYLLKELSRAGRRDCSLFHLWPEGRSRVSQQTGSHPGLLGGISFRKSLTRFSGHIISFGCRQNLDIWILLKMLKSSFQFSPKFFLRGTLRPPPFPGRTRTLEISELLGTDIF